MKDFENISDKPYLLDPNIQSEDTLDVYKSFWQILSENLTWITIFLLILISFLLFISLKRRNQNNNEIDDIEVQMSIPMMKLFRQLKNCRQKKLISNPNLLFSDYQKS